MKRYEKEFGIVAIVGVTLWGVVLFVAADLLFF